MSRFSKTIMSYLVESVIQTSTCKMYSTGELSKYFGVSVTTINNWINEDRFIGLQPKKRNARAKVSESIKWKAPSGEILSVKEVVEMYNSNPIKKVSKEEGFELLNNEIKFFEAKYNGKYEDTLKIKENKTNEEIGDESEWLYLLRRIKE